MQFSNDKLAYDSTDYPQFCVYQMMSGCCQWKQLELQSGSCTDNTGLTCSPYTEIQLQQMMSIYSTGVSGLGSTDNTGLTHSPTTDNVMQQMMCTHWTS